MSASSRAVVSDMVDNWFKAERMSSREMSLLFMVVVSGMVIVSSVSSARAPTLLLLLVVGVDVLSSSIVYPYIRISRISPYNFLLSFLVLFACGP